MALARKFWLPLGILIFNPAWAQTPFPTLYKIDPLRSRIEVRIFRTGLFGAFGHDHIILVKQLSGTVRYNPGSIRESSVKLEIQSGSLTVADQNISEKDRTEIQQTMQGNKVLDIRMFPVITFQSTRVSDAARVSGQAAIQLTGRLNLHGVEKEITFPIRLQTGQNSLQTTGTLTLDQTDFGITPVKVAGGTVRVKNQVRIDLDLSAARVAP